MKLIALLTGLTIPLFALGCGGAADDEPTGSNAQDLSFPGFPDGGPFALPPLPPLPTGFPTPVLPDAGLPRLPIGFPIPVPTGGLTLPPLPTGFPVPVLPDAGFSLPTLPTAFPVPTIPTVVLPPLPTGLPLPTLPTGFPLPPFPDAGLSLPLPIPLPGH